MLDESVTNRGVFNRCINPNLDQILLGFNSTFFAYGITGSGKTYSIFGSETVRQNYNSFSSMEAAAAAATAAANQST